MSAVASPRLSAAYHGAKRYVLRRCAVCRKFLGIVLTDTYHVVARTMCHNCYHASVRSQHRH